MFRQKVKISSLFTDKLFTDKVTVLIISTIYIQTVYSVISIVSKECMVNDRLFKNSKF